jgi:hypothetical protein
LPPSIDVERTTKRRLKSLPGGNDLEGSKLTEDLVALAQIVAARPGGRERVIAALRQVLAVVEPAGGHGGCICCSPEFKAAMGDLSASIILAADHAEYIAEKVGAVMTPVLQLVS